MHVSIPMWAIGVVSIIAALLAVSWQPPLRRCTQRVPGWVVGFGLASAASIASVMVARWW